MPPTDLSSGRTPSKLLNSIKQLLAALLVDRQYFWHLTFLLFLCETTLGLLIIYNIPYTKIDWPAYMQQVDGFLSGERDYSKLQGDTGPLVYPAFHLYIYTAFHQVLPFADRIRPAQYIFLAVYLVTFLLTATIYFRSGRTRHYPQALLIPLTLSKRAHSIALLRLFNDPLAMVLLYASVVAMMCGGKRGWSMGCFLFSLALGVKMNILLMLPGLLVLLFQYRGFVGMVENIALIVSVQLALPLPFFLSISETHLNHAYFNSAFDFSRRFLYEWTVNWKFIDEKTFHSRAWELGLLGGHLVLLTVLAWFRWSPIPGGTFGVLKRGLQQWKTPPTSPPQLPSHHIPLVLFTSNLIGMTFARSLHYQFHAWYFHQIPLLLFAGGAWDQYPIGVCLWAMVELAFATAPSTRSSSAALSVAHLVILGGLWFRRQTPFGKLTTGVEHKVT